MANVLYFINAIEMHECVCRCQYAHMWQAKGAVGDMHRKNNLYIAISYNRDNKSLYSFPFVIFREKNLCPLLEVFDSARIIWTYIDSRSVGIFMHYCIYCNVIMDSFTENTTTTTTTLNSLTTGILCHTCNGNRYNRHSWQGWINYLLHYCPETMSNRFYCLYCARCNTCMTAIDFRGSKNFKKLKNINILFLWGKNSITLTPSITLLWL